MSAKAGSGVGRVGGFSERPVTTPHVAAIEGAAPPTRRWSPQRVLQIALLCVCLVCMGGVLGVERALLPLMASDVFDEHGNTVTFAFIMTFGISKAVSNGAVGRLADLYGRKVVLVAGFMIMVPVPLVIIWARTWGVVILMNVLLGVAQGMVGSALIFMLIDVMVGRSGTAVGLAECIIYSSVAIMNYVSAEIAEVYGYRPTPFIVATSICGLGVLFSLVVRDTRAIAKAEAVVIAHHAADVTMPGEKEPGTGMALEDVREPDAETGASRSLLAKKDAVGGEGNVDTEMLRVPSTWETLKYCVTDRNVVSCLQGGFINNLMDGVAWGVFPLFFGKEYDLTVREVGIILLAYPLTWGISQLFTGALSDKYGRRFFLVTGFVSQGFCLMAVAAIPHIFEDQTTRFVLWMVALVFGGVGTAMLYPVLQAAVTDDTGPLWRASALGIYRFFRDMGYAAGAAVAGIFGDHLGLTWAIAVTAVLMILSGTFTFFAYRQNTTKIDAARVAKAKLVG